jgi:hypothetical protein
MVQILDDNSPSSQRSAAFSKIFGNIGQGLDVASQYHQMGKQRQAAQEQEFSKMAYKSKLEQQSKQEEILQKLKAFSDVEKSPEFQSLSPLQQFAIKNEVIGSITGGSAKSLINADRESQNNENFLNAMQGNGITPLNQESINDNEELSNKPPQSDKRSYIDYPTQINKLQNALQYASSPEKRASIESKIRELQSQREIEFKKSEAAQKHQFQKGQTEYQEAKPTIEYANDLAKSLPDEFQTLEAIDLALKSKDFSFFSRDNLAEMTGFEKLRSPEGALLKSSIKEYFLGDVKGVGGKGLNQWLEKQLNDAMLKMGRDNAANEIVKVGYRARYDRKQSWLDEYRKLYKKQKEEQGYVNGDIGQEVAEKVKPYYEARQKQLEAEIKAIQASGQGLSGKMLDVIGPDGAEYEIDESQVGDLPEGYKLR